MAKDIGFENHRLRTLIWIVRKLQRQSMSLKELNSLWVDDTDISAGKEIDRRTFQNYLHAIWDLFHINIECNRRNENRYKITSERISPWADMLMDNYETNLALGKASELESRVIIEKAPCGAEHLEKIMGAMEKSRNITFDFLDFNEDEGFSVTGSPYCVKLYQQRWYLVLKDEDNHIDTFCLDRIQHLKIEKTKFTIDPQFDAEDFFRLTGKTLCVN